MRVYTEILQIEGQRQREALSPTATVAAYAQPPATSGSDAEQEHNPRLKPGDVEYGEICLGDEPHGEPERILTCEGIDNGERCETKL